jgi:hypothetical protein
MLGIMPFDEPYHRGLTHDEINAVYGAIKFYFPDKLVFCNFSSINNAVKYGVPEHADVLSVTPNYSKFDLTYYLGLLDSLRNIKFPHQALMIVSNGYDIKNGGDGSDKDRVKLAYDLLQIISEEDVLGIIVFLYPSPGSKEQGVVDLPQTKKAYERIGGILTGKNFVY